MSRVYITKFPAGFIFQTDGDRTHFSVEFPFRPIFAQFSKQKDTREVTPEVERLLNEITGEHSRRELQKLLRLKDAEHFRKAYLLPAIDAGLVEMTLPDKPKSRLQKYRLTESGQAFQQKNRKSKK
jgi:ATP-dependent DNA helicase RecG